jgi:hypothetical protein
MTLTLQCLGWSGWLAGVWVEMLWPLDEGAAVPPCVRTVDQGAPDGRYSGLLLSSGLHVCALCGRVCVKQWKVSDAPRFAPSHTFGIRT